MRALRETDEDLVARGDNENIIETRRANNNDKTETSNSSEALRPNAC